MLIHLQKQTQNNMHHSGPLGKGGQRISQRSRDDHALMASVFTPVAWRTCG